MSYTAAAAVAVAAAVGLDMLVLRTRLLLRPVFWVTYAVLLLFQLIFNGVLTTRGVVQYAPEAILGPRVLGAPVEDIAFGFALVTVTLGVWLRQEPA
jgi:lycopene cyclase domain-containing protein